LVACPIEAHNPHEDRYNPKRCDSRRGSCFVLLVPDHDFSVFPGITPGVSGIPPLADDKPYLVFSSLKV
jgi:hypothetical protein